MAVITLKQAKQALDASEKEAEKLGIAVTTVVVDEHGVTIAMSRMDSAFHISPKFAETKARTSALLRMPSGQIANYSGEGKPYFGINTLFGGEITPMAGGVPITSGGVVVGAVGVGGSTDVNQDVACAEAAVKSFEAE